MTQWDKPKFYYQPVHGGSSLLLNHANHDLVLDYAIHIALLNADDSPKLSLVLNKPLLDKLGYDIRKGSYIWVRTGNGHIPFKGIVGDISISDDGTTITLEVEPFDYALKVDAPDLVHSIGSAQITTSNGEAEINGRVHVAAIGQREGGSLDGEYYKKDATFGQVNALTLPTVKSWATLFYFKSPVHGVYPKNALLIPICKNEAALDGETFFIQIWAGAMEDPGYDLKYGWELDTYPYKLLVHKEVEYNALKDYSSDLALEDALIGIGFSGEFAHAERPLFVVVSATDHPLILPEPEDKKVRYRGLIYDGYIVSPNTNMGTVNPSFMIKWDAPSSQDVSFSKVYDAESDKTRLKIKSNSDKDTLYLRALYYNITEDTTRELLKRLLWSAPNAYFVRSYPEYATLPVKVPIGAIPAGPALDSIVELCKLEGWDYYPCGYDPQAKAGGSSPSYSVGYPVIVPALDVEADQGSAINLGDDDIIERSILPHQRKAPANLFILKDATLGEIRAPLFYDNLDEAITARHFPLFDKVQASTTDGGALLNLLSDAVKYDAKGGRIIVKGHRPQLLGRIVYDSEGYYKVYALDLNPDMTTTLYLSTMPTTLISAIKSLTTQFKEVDITGGEVSISTWAHSDYSLDAPNYLNYVAITHWYGGNLTESAPIYPDGVRLRELGTITLKDGSKVRYYLLTFTALPPLRWAPSGLYQGYHYDGIEDANHWPILNKEDISFYFGEPVNIKAHIQVGNDDKVITLTIPNRPRLWYKRKFNITLAIHYNP